MQTDDVRWVSQQVTQISAEMVQQLEYLIGNIRSLDWQGGNRDVFESAAADGVQNIASTCNELNVLSQRISREVDKWENTDAEASTNFKLEIGKAIASGAFGVAGLRAAWSEASGTNIKSPYSSSEQIRRAQMELKDLIAQANNNWKNMSQSQKMDFLKKIEANLAAQQGRPITSMRYSTDSDELGESTLGQYRPGSNPPEMVINQKLLSGGFLPDLLDTVAHEGRHAYQHYAITHDGFHPNQAEVSQWRENMMPGNYVDGTKVGYHFYRNQPIEADSFAYGDRFSDAVSPENWLSERGEDLVDWMGRSVL